MRLDEQLLRMGLATPEELVPSQEERDPNRFRSFDDEPKYVLTLAQKLRLLFDFEFPGVHDLRTTGVWAAGEVLEFADFNKYVTSKRLQKQEGMVFRHLLRLILLIAESRPIHAPQRRPSKTGAPTSTTSPPGSPKSVAKSIRPAPKRRLRTRGRRG